MDNLRSRPVPAVDIAKRGAGIRRTTLVAILTNSTLVVGQIVIGLLANAFSLVADAVHTLSDLFTDIMVLIAGKQGERPADEMHPYGHGRIETVAALVLGAMLVGVGIGFLWASGMRLQNMDASPALHPVALGMAVVTLLVKETLFHYTLAASRRLNAPLLEANAWHARSDAASSLVVAIGIGGSLAGFPFLEPLAAAVVGFMIASMGIRLGWKAIRELIDTGLSEKELQRLEEVIRATSGVMDAHALRTRRMAGRVLCDTHVRVDPHITVSEGHAIANAVQHRILEAFPDVCDVLVHIDVENDDEPPPHPVPPPGREDIAAEMRALFGDVPVRPCRMLLHYLDERVEVEVVVDEADWREIDHQALRQRAEALTRSQSVYRAIGFLVQPALD